MSTARYAELQCTSHFSFLRVLYRLPELLEDLALGRAIIITEGERKVDLLRKWNIPATCNPGAAEKWTDDLSRPLAGADAIILPDNDPPGRCRVDRVAASLTAGGARVRVLELPDLPPKGDIVDWARGGGTVERLDDLIEHEAKPWRFRKGEAFEELRRQRASRMPAEFFGAVGSRLRVGDRTAGNRKPISSAAVQKCEPTRRRRAVCDRIVGRKVLR